MGGMVDFDFDFDHYLAIHAEQPTCIMHDKTSLIHHRICHPFEFLASQLIKLM